MSPTSETYAQRAGPAVSKVTKAVKSGRLVRPTTCADCDATAAVQGHHHNGYSDGHELDVVWLCRACHLRRHDRTAKPPWQRRARAYMLATRGAPDYRRLKTFSFSTLSYPAFLLKRVRTIWNLLRTDEERAAMLALVQELAASERSAVA